MNTGPMNAGRPSTALRARHRGVAALSYLAAVIALAGIAWLAIAGLQARSAALSAATELLDQIEGRRRPADVAGATSGAAPSGSPFLEGQTVTVAGAALQQRIGSAVKAVGGNVLSSQIDLQGTDSRKDFVNLIASCEVDQLGLQQLLYDLEAGMPFLFVDQLVVQSPQAVGGAEGGRLRVLIGVSGRWQGTR
ncbi:general secretion pathway protein M [Rhizobiales bacterium GAS191]|nr:general secretion pathway protein M [Rhizobiales bacterium GAS191]